MTDDGIGIRAVQQLADKYRFPPEVTIFDGGTLGLDLLPQLEGVDRLLIIDAVETGKAPGSMVRLTGDDVQPVMETKLSPHQMGLKDLLAVATLQGINPPEMVLLGVQPADIELGVDLSPAVAARLDELVAQVIRELESWGIKEISRCD